MTSKYLGLSAGFLNQAIGELVELWKVRSSSSSALFLPSAESL